MEKFRFVVFAAFVINVVIAFENTKKTKIIKIITITTHGPDGTTRVIKQEIDNPSEEELRIATNKTKPFDRKALQSSYSNDKLNYEGLKLHNEFRKKHRVGSLVLNKTLIRNAQNWATSLANENEFYHQPDNKYGENLYQGWSTNSSHVFTAKEALNGWYNEKQYYNYSTGKGTKTVGHFTQVVWKGSKYLGMGMATNAAGNVFIVAEYYPPGNYVGKFVSNVLRPR